MISVEAESLKKNNGYVKKNDQILLRWLQLLESCWLLKHNFKLGDILVFYAMFMQDFRVWPFFIMQSWKKVS